MKEKWYLQTWFICLNFAFWFLFFPLISGIVLLILNHMERQKIDQKYGAIDDLDINIRNHIDTLNKIDNDISSKMQVKNSLISEIADLEKDTICIQYDFSSYDGLTSEECKNKLTLLKSEEKEAIRQGDVVVYHGSGTKKIQNDNIKQILRCFNSECDNILLGVSVKNIDSMRSKITKSYETLNKVFAVDGVEMKRTLLEYKLQELNLVYTYELKAEQEREVQRAIKEQMIEEEKVRREIEQQKARLEKDQMQCSNEINKLMSYMQKTQIEAEKQLYIDKIKELEDRLKELEEEKKTVLDREANARAGYVYVISNIGSFGENVYKIGMTRRLEPMDRIKELSSASVPFEFDVHAMIFSDDAPKLETTLHQIFAKQSVNRVNSKKEFFRVSLDEIEKIVSENYNNTVTFTKVPVAREYNETIQILAQEQA